MTRTFGMVLDAFLDKCRGRGLQPATLKSYEYQVESFLRPTLGDVPLEMLEPRVFDALWESMHGLGYKSSTIGKCNVVARCALKLAQRNRWVTENVAALADLPRPDQVERTIPEPEGMADFLAYALRYDAEIHDYARVMAATGMRPGEAVGLQKSDLRDGVLYIERAIDCCEGFARVKTTKTGTVRKVTLDDDTQAIILARPGPWVFGGDAPARQDLLSKRWKRLAVRADVHFTPRCCRHYHATQLLGSGMTARAVADRLGHANPSITLKVYAQSIPAHDQVAADTIATVLPRSA